MTAFPDLESENEANKPVFVDPTGRRRRIVRRIALAACAGLLLYLGLFVAALFGAPIPTAALIPVPGFVPEQATSVAPPTTEEAGRATGAQRSETPSKTEAPSTRPDRSPSVATTSVPSATSAPPTSTRRNSRAPVEPPGQTRTTPPGNGH